MRRGESRRVARYGVAGIGEAAEQLAKLRGGAALASVSLTIEQMESLTHALASAALGYRDGRAVDATTIAWAVVDGEARRILSPEQFELFVRTDRSQRYSLARQAAMQAALEEAWKRRTPGVTAGTQ